MKDPNTGRKMSDDLSVGQVWKDGSQEWIIVGFDGPLVLVKRADAPKKHRHPAGGYTVSRSDVAKWALVSA